MNKYQKAFQLLRESNHSNGTELDLLQELVNRTVLFKPVPDKDFPDEFVCADDKFYYYEFRCQCGGRIGGHEKFCPDCGQVLDWSE